MRLLVEPLLQNQHGGPLVHRFPIVHLVAVTAAIQGLGGTPGREDFIHIHHRQMEIPSEVIPLLLGVAGLGTGTAIG
jgi:hypothetical protein